MRSGNVSKEDLLLYAVTDRHWLAGRSIDEVVRESLEGGVTFLQIREKEMEYDDFLDEVIRLREMCRQYGVPFVVNDNVDIAIQSGADGVHVGQSDMEAGDVRALIGPDKILGVSAHTVEEALLAESKGADYLGVGAVFPTGSKDDAKVITHDTLKEVCQAVKIPVVAIGGITKENISELVGSGIDGVAVISAIYAQDDIKSSTRELKQIVNSSLR